MPASRHRCSEPHATPTSRATDCCRLACWNATATRARKYPDFIKLTTVFYSLWRRGRDSDRHRVNPIGVASAPERAPLRSGELQT